MLCLGLSACAKDALTGDPGCVATQQAPDPSLEVALLFGWDGAMAYAPGDYDTLRMLVYSDSLELMNQAFAPNALWPAFATSRSLPLLGTLDQLCGRCRGFGIDNLTTHVVIGASDTLTLTDIQFTAARGCAPDHIRSLQVNGNQLEFHADTARLYVHRGL
ncbi:MAG: hypothetical protein AAGB22_09270 [Bacteroidota bacterium]